MLRELPTGIRCAELGVFAGDFARDIKRILSPSRLYLVDLFAGEFTSSDQNGENRITLHMPTVERMLLREFHDATIDRSESVSWLKSMPENALDFIYIDTTHSYDQTTAELREAMRVVAPGGWLSGHDYHERFPGVIQAVEELGLPFNLTNDGIPSFLIKVPN